MTPFLNPTLRAAMSRWPPEAREAAEERAAIRQYEGGESREKAEAGAFVEADGERRQAAHPKVGRG